MRGEGGGIYLIYSEAEIESGTINKNTAIAAAPDENGNIQGGLGGAISAKYSRVTIKGDTKIRNNSAGNRGGAIYTEGTTNDSSLLNDRRWNYQRQSCEWKRSRYIRYMFQGKQT